MPEQTITVTLTRELAERARRDARTGAEQRRAEGEVFSAIIDALDNPQPERPVRFDLPERLRTDDLGGDLADELRTKATDLREVEDSPGNEKDAAMLDEAAEVFEWAGSQVETLSLRQTDR